MPEPLTSRSLLEIRELNRRANPAEAERAMRRLLVGSSIDSILDLEAEVNATIGSFFRKRATALQALLAARLAEARVPETIDVATFYEQTRLALKNLSEKHNSEWATSYRGAVSSIYLDALVLARRGAPEEDVCRRLHSAFAEHALEIYEKGLRNASARGPTGSAAQQRALYGLKSFSDICLQYYGMRAPSTHDVCEIQRHRGFASSIVAGILQGFGEATYGEEQGGYGHVPSSGVEVGVR